MLMNLLLSWLILALAFWVTAAVLRGFHLRSFGGAIVVAAIFGVLNALLGWLFWVVFTIATLGIALLLAFITQWIINAILLKLTASFSKSLKIDGFGWALLGALMISLVSTVTQWLLASVF